MDADDHFGFSASLPTGKLIALDADLRNLASFPLPPDALGVHGVGPDLDRAVVSGKSRIVAIDQSGRELWQVPHQQWGGGDREGGSGDSESGSCAFDSDAQLVWAHVPSARGADQLILIDAADGSMSGAVELACCAAGSRFIRHPNNVDIALEVGEGQDGSDIYLARVEGGAPSVRRVGDGTRVLAGFSLDGSMFLTVPHDDGPLLLHRFPEGEVIARREFDWLASKTMRSTTTRGLFSPT